CPGKMWNYPGQLRKTIKMSHASCVYKHDSCVIYVRGMGQFSTTFMLRHTQSRKRRDKPIFGPAFSEQK
ncbi:hypothetical protein, partial [Pseudomonas aeruginosa]